MNRIFLRLLNIRPSEVWLVKNLFLFNLFQSIGIALLLTISNALFLAQFDIEVLPKVYMLSAVVLLAMNYIYGKLEHRLPIQKLILYLLIAAAVSILIIRLMIYSKHYEFAPVLLLVWYQVIYLLLGSSFWAMAAQLFDVRESKRTFGILSAGDTPAKFLGYLSVSVFAGIIGLNNFLFISAICFVVAFLFMQRIVRAGRIDFGHLSGHTSKEAIVHNKIIPGSAGIVKSFFSNNLILLISVLSFILVVALTVVDFTFLSEVKTKYKDDVALASFLASFLAIGRLVTILAKITLTSRIEQELGIKRTLLILPILLILFALFILISVRIEGDFPYYLYVFGCMVVLTEVLKSVLQEPLILVLFQPLKPILRLKGHSISKGILTPLGLFFAGLILYGSIQWTGNVDIIYTSLFLLAISTSWIIVIYLLDKQYLATLIDSLKQGFFRGNVMLVNNPAVTAILLEKMKSSRPSEVLFAADTSERLGAIDFTATLRLLLKHEQVIVRKYALKKIREKKLDALLPDLRLMLNDTREDDVRIDCLAILSAMGEVQTKELSVYLHHADLKLQQHAMAALFSSGDIDGIILCVNKLKGWIDSSNTEERIAAAQLIGSVTAIDLHASLSKLLNDSSVSVQKFAIEAAANTKNIHLIPLLVRQLDKPANAVAAAAALKAYGQDVISYLPDIQKLKSQDLKLAEQYIKIATHLQGEKATAYLESILFSYPAMKSAVIDGLKERSHTAAAALKQSYVRLIYEELDYAAETIRHHQMLQSEEMTHDLCSALLTELKKIEINVFYLLTFIYERQKLLQAFNSIRTGKKDNIANALEIIDIGVTKRISTLFIPILEYLHLHQVFQDGIPAKKDDITVQLRQIISRYPLKFGAWTAAIAIYTYNRISSTECAAFISKFDPNGNYLLEETRNFVLSNQN